MPLEEQSQRRSRESARIEDLKELIRVQFAHLRRELRSIDQQRRDADTYAADLEERISKLELSVALIIERSVKKDADEKFFTPKVLAALGTGGAAALVYLWEKFNG